MTTPTAVTSPSPRPPLADRLRRERYLLSLRLWLDDDYPSAQRRALLAQLRADLDAAAADTSMRDAVASLGPARLLASEYSSLLDRGRVRWGLGAAAASSWLMACLLATLIFAAALWQVAPGAGADGESARLLWAEVTVVNTPEESSLEVTEGVPWTLLVTLAVFLGWARVWRLVPALRRGETDGR